MLLMPLGLGLANVDGEGSVFGDAGDGDGESVGVVTDGAEDLAALFTPEQIEARKAELAATKAEDERRAALTQEQRDAEDAEKAKAEAAKSVPEVYDIKFSEGLEVAQDLYDEFVPLAKELGLTNDQAQKLADFEQKLVERRQADYFAMTEGWTEAAKQDKEIGGANWAESVKIAERALNTIGTPELRQLFGMYKIGKHPEMVRLMVRVGKSIREDGGIIAGATDNGKKGDMASRLYGG